MTLFCTFALQKVNHQNYKTLSNKKSLLKVQLEDLLKLLLWKRGFLIGSFNPWYKHLECVCTFIMRCYAKYVSFLYIDLFWKI